MRFLVGILIVLGAVFTGYLIVGGHLDVLWQPSEFIIILGSAAGSYIISNSSRSLGHTGHALSMSISGSSLGKKEYLELLLLLFNIFKTARSKGLLSLEQHLDNPQNSDLFSKYPSFLKNKYATSFLCDYLRLMTMGCDNAMQIENLIDQELEVLENEEHHISGALQNLADATPALGIVAAVLGVIHTMGSIDQPPAVLGKLIGGALVGTFLGVLVSYGILGPMANSLKETQHSDIRYLFVIKAGILGYLNGLAPILAVEFARKNVTEDFRPTFSEIEIASQNI